MKWVISNEFDAFDFDDTTYSLEDFYTKSVDSRGHREMTRVAFPPNVLSTLSTIVQSGKIPAYRTVQDVIRDAVLHRIWWLERYALKESYGIIDYTSLKMVKLQQAVENSLKEGERMEAIVSTAEKALEHHRLIKDKEEMIRLLNELRNQLDNIREPFRGRLKSIIERFEYIEKEN